MTYCHFCILFIRSESQGPAHTQKKRITHKCEFKEAAIIWAIVEAESHIILHIWGICGELHIGKKKAHPL